MLTVLFLAFLTPAHAADRADYALLRQEALELASTLSHAGDCAFDAHDVNGTLVLRVKDADGQTVELAIRESDELRVATRGYGEGSGERIYSFADGTAFRHVVASDAFERAELIGADGRSLSCELHL
jgi:hypothetical protein